MHNCIVLFSTADKESGLQSQLVCQVRSMRLDKRCSLLATAFSWSKHSIRYIKGLGKEKNAGRKNSEFFFCILFEANSKEKFNFGLKGLKLSPNLLFYATALVKRGSFLPEGIAWCIHLDNSNKKC